MSPVLEERAAAVRSKARQLGFDLCEFAPAQPSQRRAYYEQWIAGGRHGEMHYLADRLDERLDTTVYFEPARTVICLATNYHVPLTPPENPGRVARYALGRDYHEFVDKRIKQMADWLRDTWPGTKTKIACDTAPVLERELAVLAGIGWQGKNTCVISPKIGSWIFLAEVFTSLELPLGTPATDHCGTCTRCIDACPTDAITAPYQLDASRCISYLTIEKRSDPDAATAAMVGEWLFGCDVCQDVCPFNGRAPTAIDPLLQPRFPDGRVDPAKVADWTLEEYHVATRRSAMRRVKLPQFQRNGRLVSENTHESAASVPPAPAGDRLPD